MATIEQLSLGVSDAERAARFWAAALDYRRRAPRFDGDEWIVLEPQPGAPGMAIAMDLSESPVQDFPRLHLDLDAGERSLDEELDRLLALGAKRVDWRHYPTDPHPTEPPYVVLADPEGNRFCVSGRRERPAR
ncbi:putative enzyme related to lactoylglutathione lyase [Micromonospora sp. A202]|uniref:VOC family protein n=1 Tax=Micromonospora sp. A202 TaxID=2572899 RepID=UPI00114E95B2|nr:VOC family protein [Micromonospora sp. A202]TQJ21169.1 putative enzyme related to lactoylglutathione lyase [Micromonospora sp. A202]